MTSLDERVAAKRAAGDAAADRYVSDGMVVGLGSGSTALWAIRRIGARIGEGSLGGVVGVPTSHASAHEAVSCGIPLTTLDDHPRIDVTLDGADEVAPNLDVIKGGGGALLGEKIVAQASHSLVIVVDEPKLVPALGTGFPVPVAVDPFALRVEELFLESLGATVSRRTTATGELFVSDQGHHILDADFGPVTEPAALLELLHRRAGVMEVGLFLGLTSCVVVAGADGGIRVLEPDAG